MTDQLDLLNYKPALPPFARNSATSRSGALEAYAKAPGQCARIYEQIRLAGEWGCTSLELKRKTSISESSTMAARLNSLMKSGKIKDSGMQRNGVGKAMQTVWVIV